jgi:aldehyde dehydrogenase (NAD+)
MPTMSYLETVNNALASFGIEENNPGLHVGTSAQGTEEGKQLESISPVDGKLIGRIELAEAEDLEHTLERAQEAFKAWRQWPAPVRGDIIRQIGDELRKHKDALGVINSYECGKMLEEGKGEVQEIIDICDFAVGQSRQDFGRMMLSERPDHRLYEQWHPLGVVGVITAFNFPMAVWGWNTMVAAMCGNCVIWKPSEKTPLSALALMRLVQKVANENDVPAGVFNMVAGAREVGEAMAQNPGIHVLSATGSVAMGRAVAQQVAARLGRSILELGGNNAIIVSPSADLELAKRATIFAAVGAAGQRCTSARRLIVHEAVYEPFKQSLLKAYESLQGRIGNPLDPNVLVGPLIDSDALQAMQLALKEVQVEGGELLIGGEPKEVNGLENGVYVEPCIVAAESHYETVKRETFAPILYLMKYSGNIDTAIAMQNDVPQGLASSLFSTDLKETERYLSVNGSDCGLVNVNVGPSGAEIGGAFGGEKDTGSSRESGSDAWKAYMRRQTVTINYSDELPLAQGIEFDV